MSFNVLGNLDAFLIGMNLEASKESNDSRKIKQKIEEVSKNLDQDYRSVYDGIIPNIHILDADYSAKLLLKDLENHPERYFSKYKRKDPEDGFYYEEDLDVNIAKSLVPVLLTPSVRSTIATKVVEAVKDFHNKLPKKSSNPLEELDIAMRETFSELENSLTDPNTLPDVKIVLVTKLGAKFKREIDKIFGRDALIGLDLPELGSSSTRFIFFAKQFARMSDRINKEIGKTFAKALEDSAKIAEVFIARETVRVGEVIHFAHTGIKNGGFTFLNSPAYSKLVFNTVNSPAGNQKSPFSNALRAGNYFKSKTGHTKLALKVDNTVGQKYGVLLALGLTITTDHSATLNLLVGKRESKYSSGLFGSAQKATEALRNFLRTRGSAEIVKKLATDKPQFLQSSPSIIQKLRKQIVDTIKTGNSVDLVNKLNTTKSVKDFTYLSPTKIKTSKLNTKLKPKSKTLPRIQEPKAATKPVSKSRVNLINLLNATLHDQIRKNMGTGDRRDVLNYRSGRFATSVKVERVSESRMGMITAFYTYMKNPYATFSQGGRQGFPRTRDPKLLISKSIREIASTLVTNQLRAVNV